MLQIACSMEGKWQDRCRGGKTEQIRKHIPRGRGKKSLARFSTKKMCKWTPHCCDLKINYLLPYLSHHTHTHVWQLKSQCLPSASPLVPTQVVTSFVQRNNLWIVTYCHIGYSPLFHAQHIPYPIQIPSKFPYPNHHSSNFWWQKLHFPWWITHSGTLLR